jgi:hypothetical protein
MILGFQQQELGTPTNSAGQCSLQLPLSRQVVDSYP